MQPNEFEAFDDPLQTQNDGSAKTDDTQKGILAYLHDIVYTLIGVLLVMMLLFRIIVVSGPSMNMTLMDGDYILLLNNLFYREIKPGDIVVVSKQSFKNGEPIIKRVIATEGQTVDIDFNSGVVFVDGKALDEPYVNTPTTLYEGVRFPLTVDEGCIFALGDNRNDSKDSRNPEIGLIDEREVLGKALFLFYPGKDAVTSQRYFNRIGAL